MVTPQKNLEPKQLNSKTITWGDLTWVDIVEPTEEAKKYLAENYNFHPLDLDDCLSRRQLSKIDEYQQYLFVIFHLPVYDKAKRVSTTRRWSAFIGDKFLVTLHPTRLSAPDELFRECESSEEARREYLSNGSGYLLYVIMDRVLDAYFPILDKIMSLIEDVEDNVFDEEIEEAKEISILRRDILTQRHVMFPTRTLLAELENKLKRFSKTDLSVYYGDLMDHMSKICDTLDECKEMIEVFKDADYVLSGYRSNNVIRILAILLAVGLPFLVVSGVYGMRVILPGGIDEGSPLIFILLLVIIFIFIGATLYFFRRRHLI
jgi:magnesium transporter